MAQQDKAKKALKTAMYSSVVADVISNVALIFFAAYLAKIALNFGPPEYFWLICFSLTIIVSVSGISVVKGLIAAFLGIIVSTIGLFAIPEVIDFYTSRVAPHIRTAVTGASLTWKEFKASLKTIIRGSIIGVIIGAIPGTGATAAAFISYNDAKRRSPNRDNFGKGEVEGVAAAEAGNNGVAGATMIPLLSLGIPGDVITAIILGAFMVHGLTPGPILFQENLPLIYALFLGIMLSSVILLFVGNAAIRYFSLIADIPKAILFPIVLMFCVYGAYAVNNDTFDVWLMLAFGLLGYVFNRTGIPAAPFLIGFILGPMFEDNLRRSLLIGSNDLSIFVRGPITWFFIALTIGSFSLAIYRFIKAQKESKRSVDESST